MGTDKKQSLKSKLSGHYNDFKTRTFLKTTSTIRTQRSFTPELRDDNERYAQEKQKFITLRQEYKAIVASIEAYRKQFAISMKIQSDLGIQLMNLLTVEEIGKRTNKIELFSKALQNINENNPTIQNIYSTDTLLSVTITGIEKYITTMDQTDVLINARERLKEEYDQLTQQLNTLYQTKSSSDKSVCQKETQLVTIEKRLEEMTEKLLQVFQQYQLQKQSAIEKDLEMLRKTIYEMYTRGKEQFNFTLVSAQAKESSTVDTRSAVIEDNIPPPPPPPPSEEEISPPPALQPPPPPPPIEKPPTNDLNELKKQILQSSISKYQFAPAPASHRNSLRYTRPLTFDADIETSTKLPVPRRSPRTSVSTDSVT